MDYMSMALAQALMGGGSGTSDYSQLSNKPQINGVTLDGNKTSADLGLMPQVYSTTEEEVGTWIDGTPIYQSTVNFGSLPNATTKTVLTDILAEDIIQINVVANTKTATGVGYKNIIQNIPNGYIGGGDITFVAKIDTNNKIELNITTGSDRTAYNGYVTVQYTKPSN